MNGKLANLYGHYLSIPSCNVGLILSMDGIAHSYQHVDLMKGAKKELSFQALNRFAQVTAVVHAKRIIAQSCAILVYLAEQFAALDGDTEEERLGEREWLCWQADRLYNITWARSQIKFQNGAPAVVEQLQNASRNALGVLDAHLESVEFVACEVPTIADVASYSMIAYAEDAELDVSDWPAVAAWHSRMAALDGCGDLDEIMPREDRA